jgi:hypothetical protein
MGMRLCQCCEKWWDVEIGKKPGLYRKRAADGFIHEFVRHMPPRQYWKQTEEYCITCMKVNPLYIGPITGKGYRNCC